MCNLCMYVHMQGNHIFCIENENTTHVVILEDSENMDPLFDVVLLLLVW